MKRIKPATLCLIVFTLTLSSCAQNGLQIGNSLTLCCPGSYQTYEAYRIETKNMPIFLQDYVVSEFEIAFNELGMERNDQINDLVVTLTYEHVNLNAEQEYIDPFFRSESITEDLRYIAVVDINMRETATNKSVWGGKISRIHTVSTGEYMHEGRARGAFLQTFRDLLTSYPSNIAYNVM